EELDALAEEAPDDAAEPDGGIPCTTSADCPDDGIYCNGILVCTAGRCVVSGIPSCDDAVTCTVDSCDPVMDRCQNVPDDTRCPAGTRCRAVDGCVVPPACEFDTDCPGDGVFCNGVEVCVGGNCVSPGRTCDDRNDCTMDACSE